MPGVAKEGLAMMRCVWAAIPADKEPLFVLDLSYFVAAGGYERF